jgi:hypothetical protein
MTHTAYCLRCKKQVGYHYDPVNHWKQLLLTIGTVGLWLPMWICMTYSPTKLCNDCNEPIWDGIPAIRPQRG